MKRPGIIYDRAGPQNPGIHTRARFTFIDFNYYATHRQELIPISFGQIGTRAGTRIARGAIKFYF